MNIQSIFWLTGTVTLALAAPGLAQSITAAPDGTGTLITIEGNTYQIQGGTPAGANLFHSFQDFGLSQGEIAHFLSDPNISNIFGRVVGGNASMIDGLIQANPNLYLINPAGIVFGANASLNVGGDFFATTADQICFAGGCLNAVGPNDYSTLFGSPTTLGFLQPQSGSLINAGTLAVQKGKSIHLSGDTVVNLGQIAAPGGMATVAAIPGERRVRLNQPGSLLSLEVTEQVVTDGINPLALPELLTAIPEHLQTKAIAVPPGNVMIEGAIAAGQIDLYTTGQVTPSDPNLIQGDTRVVRFSTSGENPNQAVFIDRRADHPDELLYGATAGTVSQIIERDENGVSVISEQLSVISDSIGALESIAIIAEGNVGNFWLGNQWIRAATIADYAAPLQTWGDALTTNADILLYSCFTALGATGEALVQSIADLTGVDVAASVDATGSADYGANWELEHSTLSGSIAAANPFTAETVANWQGKLATRTVTTTDDLLTTNSLRNAIEGDAAGTYTTPIGVNDTVTFNISGSPTITLGGEIYWSTENITIDGANISGSNVVVDGGGNGRVFHTTASNATIQNITIQGGELASGYGAGILQSDIAGTLTIDNVTITGNSAEDGGGGIDSNGSATITNSIITGNLAERGGGIYSAGVLTLINSTVSNNSAESGGGIFATADANIQSSTITNNTAEDGGGIRTSNVVDHSLMATGSSISGNSATTGGDVSTETATVIISDVAGDLTIDLATQTAVSLSGSGSITVTGDVTTNGLDFTVNAADNLDLRDLTLNSASGSNLTLTAGGDINTKNLITSNTSGAGAGGNITVTSTGGSINTFNGTLGSIDTRGSGTTNNAGTVTLRAAQEIATGPINTESTEGAGGAVTLESGTFVTVNGTVASTASSVTFPASISTAGATAGGAILIRHGGNGLVPFTVGDASVNGTSAAITTGANTILPINAYLFSEIQPGIEILTNGTLGTGLATVIAGTKPINQTLTTADLIRLIGQQAGGETTLNEEGEFTWELPGEQAFGGSLEDNGILTEFTRLDTYLTSHYTTLSEEIAEDPSQEDGDQGDDSQKVGGGTVANLHETFERIQAQTGTVPAMIYALSQPDALELIVVTPDNQLLRKVVPAADRDTLRNTIRTLRRRITSTSPGYLEPAQQLYDWLIRPIASSINNLNIDTLVFAMGDGLRSVPLAALHNGDQFLIEQYSLGQIPSLSLTDSSYVPLQDAQVLAMGASQFKQLEPLPAVPSELMAVTSLKAGAQYLNQAFTWENLATQSRDRNFEIVHLATHAAFRPGAATNSYIQLWGNEKIGVDQLRELRWFEDPKVELLVLSACQTALGDPYAELGFAGLAVQAGVKTTLASLWQISDLSTMRLMREFYAQLNNPDVTIKAEALRQAQLALLRGEATAGNGLSPGVALPPALVSQANTDLSHPFYWSAFTLVGSPW